MKYQLFIQFLQNSHFLSINCNAKKVLHFAWHTLHFEFCGGQLSMLHQNNSLTSSILLLPYQVEQTTYNLNFKKFAPTLSLTKNLREKQKHQPAFYSIRGT
eukprot:TRINITY_DN3535_c3_g1_i1.p2 TRINITY_DN3535_c3_g1~~TRINITY_DN3535_c3_g1_i1.p2  ORF type:complete len:101 (+),score=3.96 TRINITY_DN3535_c3_g1_i1:146-448(+)